MCFSIFVIICLNSGGFMDKVFSGEVTLLKALAIMLVVSGHLEFSIFGMFPPYSFQLALFFFISGMLFKDKYLDEVAIYFVRRIKSLLVPYFIYEAVYLLITFAFVPIIGEFFGAEPSLRNFFITPFTNAHQLSFIAPMWFVTQLFITMIVFLFLMRVMRPIKNKWIHLAFYAFLGFTAIPIWKAIPHNSLSLIAMRTSFSLFFVYLGYFYVKYIKDNKDIFTPKWLGGVILFQSVLWLYNRDYDPVHGIGLSYVLVNGRFDDQIIVPVLTAITGIWISLYAIKVLYPYLKDVKFLQQMGKVTYHIMANHVFVMYVITLILFHITGTPLSAKGDKIYAIYNPVQTTYLYFVVVMLVTTYFGVFQQFAWKKIKEKVFRI